MANSCITVDHDEEYVLSNETLRRARKEHECGECRDKIKPGDLYENHKGLYDGAWDEHKTCARCLNIREDYFHGWFWGMMVEMFEDAHGFDYRKGLPADFAPCEDRG
jgi:hypothetical protein